LRSLLGHRQHAAFFSQLDVAEAIRTQTQALGGLDDGQQIVGSYPKAAELVQVLASPGHLPEVLQETEDHSYGRVG
jgi:hypothetical protein